MSLESSVRLAANGLQPSPSAQSALDYPWFTDEDSEALVAVVCPWSHNEFVGKQEHSPGVLAP